MVEFILYYNKVYKHTCNLITKKVKGHYIYINKDLNEVYIDNVKVATYEELNQITFMVKGYKQIIDCNSKGTIYSMDIEMPAHKEVQIMEEIRNIHHCKYDLQGNLYFEANGKQYKIACKEALEIAYTLFDSVGYSYDELDEISEELI